VRLVPVTEANDTRRRTSRLPDSRAAADGGAIPPVEESPGSTGTRCRLTAGGGDPRESATESKPPVQGGRREQVCPAGKGETVRQERTASLATGAAW
jgi:hypothetical protein